MSKPKPISRNVGRFCFAHLKIEMRSSVWKRSRWSLPSLGRKSSAFLFSENKDFSVFGNRAGEENANRRANGEQLIFRSKSTEECNPFVWGSGWQALIGVQRQTPRLGFQRAKALGPVKCCLRHFIKGYYLPQSRQIPSLRSGFIPCPERRVWRNGTTTYPPQWQG